ncbi:MAG TPA: response regulator, partial [Burkholderiales bacterium]|nr:response regulator [Burkholderiales bacterium]
TRSERERAMNAQKGKDGGVEILIAEDSATQREQLQHLLEEHGYAVAAVANGKAALEAVRRRKPAVIVSDIVMPELDGYGLCRALKSDETLGDIPIVLLTTLADVRDVILGLECGADNFIRKPYQGDYLLQRVEYLLMNLELRRNQKMRMGIEISLGGQRHFITAERQQILDLLISTYEQATHINKDLAAANKELGAANQELESFSYSVSHDLRAPLRAIDGYSRILQEAYAALLDEEGRRLLSVVRENSLRMGRLIDDLLAFSRFGRQALVKELFDTGALLREILVELGLAGNQPAAAVALGELSPSWGDRALLKQVWTNLLSNAVKYSSAKPAPRIEIAGSEAAGESVYRVKDNGAGFDMRYYDKLFGVFQRLHAEKDFPGTGVGLAMVQRVVIRHGGRVWAQGQPGEGAEFFFSLPKQG